MQKAAAPPLKRNKAIDSYVHHIRSTATKHKQTKHDPHELVNKENALSAILDDSNSTLTLLQDCRRECSELQKARTDDKREYGRLLQAAADEIKNLQQKVKEKDWSRSRQQSYDLLRQKSKVVKDRSELQKKLAEEGTRITAHKQELAKKYEGQYSQLKQFYQTLQESLVQQHVLEQQSLQAQFMSKLHEKDDVIKDLQVKHIMQIRAMQEQYEREVAQLNIIIEETKVMLNGGK